MQDPVAEIQREALPWRGNRTDSSLLIPRRRSVCSRQLQIPGVPLSRRTSPAPAATPQLSPSSAPETSRERLPGGEKASHKDEAACFRSTPEDRLGTVSWAAGGNKLWRPGGNDFYSSTEKRGSLVPGRPYSNSLVSFQESPTKQRGDKREVK
ncbi:unnamed protein product [Coregonus sp. 'balchen']|nr:unnamed protein product [Coregonus sp. 'balchen']